MSKVIRILLKKCHVPIDKSVFKVGTSVNFDCYIQRFNGYFIVINAGTILDEKLYKYITTDKLQIFILNENYNDYKNYVKKHKNIDSLEKTDLVLKDEIEKSLNIDTLLANETEVSQKLKIIYFQAKNLINAWLQEDSITKLPSEAFDSIAENLVHIVDENKITLSILNEFMDGKYTLATHLVNVSFFTSLVGNQLDLDLDDKKKLVLSAMYHDVGKTEIDENLLDKPDLLSDREYKVIKEHSLKSVKILRKSGIHDRVIASAIKNHHERLDGSGYPEGINSRRICEFGQILAVCDVFDALVTNKPYRGAYTTFNALKLIRDEYKNSLNMKYVNIFIKLLN